MQLKRELGELLALDDQDSMFLSVYLDTTVNQEGHRSYPIFFKQKVSVLSKMYEAEEDAHKLRSFRDNIETIEHFLNHDLHADTKGVAIFSSTDRDYFKALQLPMAVKQKFTVSSSPNLQVLIELAEENKHYGVVVLDQHSGRLLSLYLSSLNGEQQLTDETVPGRTKVGGWSQMRYQRHRQDHILHFMKELAEELREFCRDYDPDAILLLGTQTNVAEFQRQLPQEIIEKVLLTRPAPSRSEEKQLVTTLSGFIEEAEEARRKVAIEQLHDRLCQDYLATVGVDETLFNLQSGKLERLFLSRVFEGRGQRCKKCQFIFGENLEECKYCAGELETVDLRNRLEKLAEHHEVAIEVVQSRTFLDSLGGVGGFLKF